MLFRDRSLGIENFIFATTFAKLELSSNILKGLKGRDACLISNHGQVSTGSNLSDAFELAEEIENICHQYMLVLKVGKPKVLTKIEMNNVLKKIKNYKNNK